MSAWQVLNQPAFSERWFEKRHFKSGGCGRFLAYSRGIDPLFSLKELCSWPAALHSPSEFTSLFSSPRKSWGSSAAPEQAQGRSARRWWGDDGLADDRFKTAGLTGVRLFCLRGFAVFRAPAGFGGSLPARAAPCDRGAGRHRRWCRPGRRQSDPARAAPSDRCR